MTLPKGTLQLNHGQLQAPVFLPDATLGVVRAVDAEDLQACRIEGLVMNTFHLMQRPGSSTIQSLGGLHRMSGWTGPIITDSGGFQAYSLIRQNPKSGRLTERGITFQPEGSSRKFQLTPEKTVQLQLSYGTDVVICLDDCTHIDDPYPVQAEAVERTITWGRRCKTEFLRLLEGKRQSAGPRPLLFGVIQGGGELDLRQRCAEALLEIGFDGFGFGGWPLDAGGTLLTDILGYTRQLVPPELPMHALGVGHPQNVLTCYELGYNLFDSAMPTRDARHGRLYTFASAPEDPQSGLVGDWLDYFYIGDQKHIKNSLPVSAYCDALCCRRYSAGYIHHLFKISDTLFFRLATIHNLRFMTQLAERIRSRTA